MSHNIVPLSAENLPHLDVGMFGREIDRQIQTIVDDIQGRPCDAAGRSHSRELRIKLVFVPEVEFDSTSRTNHLKRIRVEPEVKGVLPATKGGVTDVRIVRHRAHFNQDVPSEFTQRSLDYDDEEVCEK